MKSLLASAFLLVSVSAQPICQIGCPPTPCLNSSICMGECVCLKVGTGGMGRCVLVN